MNADILQAFNAFIREKSCFSTHEYSLTIITQLAWQIATNIGLLLLCTLICVKNYTELSIIGKLYWISTYSQFKLAEPYKLKYEKKKKVQLVG